jgi:hypothetical protein
MRLLKWLGGLLATALAVPLMALFLFHVVHGEAPPTYFNVLFWIDPASPDCEAEYDSNNPPFLNADFSDVCPHWAPPIPGRPGTEQPEDVPTPDS